MSKGGKIMIAVLLGVMAAFFGMLYLMNQREQILGGSQVVRVYVATDDIKTNTPLGKDLVSVRSVPKSFLQPGSITVADVPDANKITGVTIVPIKEGEQILRTKLYEGAPPPLSSEIKNKNMVAVGIAMESLPNSVHGLVRAGDHVDVLASFKFEKTKDEDFIEIRPLFQNVEVLAVNERSAGNQKPTTEKAGADQNVDKVAKTVTLALPPVAAQQVVLAQQLGNIWLLLRATGDTAPHQYEIWNNERLLRSQFRLWRSESPQVQMMREMASRR
jgi:Flp pilus assembly protein CpaB